MPRLVSKSKLKMKYRFYLPIPGGFHLEVYTNRIFLTVQEKCEKISSYSLVTKRPNSKKLGYLIV